MMGMGLFAALDKCHRKGIRLRLCSNCGYMIYHYHPDCDACRYIRGEKWSKTFKLLKIKNENNGIHALRKV